MSENYNPIYPNANREPWNKGKLIGPKPPLRPKHVWAIRVRLELAEHHRGAVNAINSLDVVCLYCLHSKLLALLHTMLGKLTLFEKPQISDQLQGARQRSYI